MKSKTKRHIASAYLLIVVILLLRLFLISFDEVVDTESFTDYYQTDAAQNGGLELSTENFTTFVKEYTFSPKVIKKELEKPKEETKKVEMLTYKVVAGDNPTKIAEKLNLSFDTIKINNPVLKNGKLNINQKLFYPSKNGMFYKIKKGDSLIRIAKRYGINVADIVDNNEINPRRLKVGEKIFLPEITYKKVSELENIRKKPQKTSNKRISSNQKTSSRKTQTSSLGFYYPVRYRGVSSPFGNRFHPVLKRYILHTGVDLIAKYVPLRAAKTGTVSFAGYMNGYGKIIIIKHSNNYETRYAHLSVISTRVGEKVNRGELIGKTGKTGRVTGPHLHFEIRYKGVPKNPMRYL